MMQYPQTREEKEADRQKQANFAAQFARETQDRERGKREINANSYTPKVIPRYATWDRAWENNQLRIYAVQQHHLFPVSCFMSEGVKIPGHPWRGRSQ